MPIVAFRSAKVRNLRGAKGDYEESNFRGAKGDYEESNFRGAKGDYESHRAASA
jgi:hypothetical protein